MPPCYVKYCQTGRSEFGFQSFKFPIGKPEVRFWISFIGKPSNWIPSNSASICIRHFDDNNLVPLSKNLNLNGHQCKKRRLTKGAIPTVKVMNVGTYN